MSTESQDLILVVGEPVGTGSLQAAVKHAELSIALASFSADDALQEVAQEAVPERSAWGNPGFMEEVAEAFQMLLEANARRARENDERLSEVVAKVLQATIPACLPVERIIKQRRRPSRIPHRLKHLQWPPQ